MKVNTITLLCMVHLVLAVNLYTNKHRDLTYYQLLYNMDNIVLLRVDEVRKVAP